MIHIYDNDKQMIAVVHDFITQDECEEILAHSWQNMERSTVASKDGKGQKHSKRTGSNTWLQHDASPIIKDVAERISQMVSCLLYTSPSPRDRQKSRMPSSA